MPKTKEKPKSKTQYWAINATSWGIRLFEGTEAKAEEWRAHKANWEGCVAWKTEIPKWLFDSMRWHQKNEIAYSTAVHKTFPTKEEREKFMVLKESLRAEYASQKED